MAALALLILAIWGLVAMGRWAHRIARSKGISSWSWVILTVAGTLFYVIPGFIIIWLLSNQRSTRPDDPYQGQIYLGVNEATKKCPRCAEEVKQAAKICRYCRYEFQDRQA